VKLTPQQKQQKAELLDLAKARNRAVSSLNFGIIKTYEDFLVSLGHNRQVLQQYYHNPSALNAVATREAVLAFFGSYETELLQRHAGIYDRFTYEFVPHEYEGTYYDGTTSTGAPANIVDSDLIVAGDNPDTLEECLPDSPKQVCKLFAFQERAAVQLLNNIIKKNMRGQMLRAAVGTGKTFIIGAVARRLLDMQFTDGKTYSPWPIVYVTKASIVQQTERVLENLFGIDIVNEVKVINIEQLRASFGELMVRTETVVKWGQEEVKWVWRKGVHPLIILWDECQILKNTGSQQSALAQAFNEINDPETFQIFFSATPFLRVCEAKCFAVATRLKRKYGITEGVPLSNENWPDFAAHVASPAEPEEYVEAAIKRLMDALDDYVVQVTGVRPQFVARNNVVFTHFKNAEEKKFYDDAWERCEERKKKIEGYGLSDSKTRFLVLAQFTIFCKAAELCHAEDAADRMVADVKAGKAAYLAVRFKGTIRRVVQFLVDKHGVSRDDISLIWGGGKSARNEKQKKKEKLEATPDVLVLLSELGMSMDDMNLADVEDYQDDDKDNALTDRLRLGVQSKKERQREIDKYQSGRAHYAIYSFKAGGVGLSLHHTDELTNQWNTLAEGFDEWVKMIEDWNKRHPAKKDQVLPGKIRRKPNNWIYPEDVRYVTTRQRSGYLIFPLSALELVQGLGRGPRITSFSDTEQKVLCYAGTIEERVGHMMAQRLKCLKEVVKNIRESWQEVILTGHSDTTPIIDNTPETSDADNTAALFGDSVEEDEEESIEV